MPELDENGLFAGLSKDDKASAVLNHLSVNTEITLQQLMTATGLTSSQIHSGIRHLREAKPECVITIRRGVASAYKLAEDAPEVRDYAISRMRHWQASIKVVHTEMQTARRFLPEADANKVQLAAESLIALLRILELTDAERRELQKKERSLDRQAARLAARTPKRRKPAPVS